MDNHWLSVSRFTCSGEARSENTGQTIPDRHQAQTTGRQTELATSPLCHSASMPMMTVISFALMAFDD